MAMPNSLTQPQSGRSFRISWPAPRIVLLVSCLVCAEKSRAQDRHGAERPIPVVTVDKSPEWDCSTVPREYVYWRSRVGTKVGPAVIARDRILVGTNNGNPRDGKRTVDLAALMCFQADDGKFLWQATHSRLPYPEDLPTMALMSRPFVEKENAYYVSNRGELVRLELDGRMVWKLDMVKALGVQKQDASDVGNPICSPLVVGDLVYCVTGHGADGYQSPHPDAPSFLAVNKASGKVVWSSNAPGKNIIYGQWSSPVFARTNGVDQVIFPGGDGCLYGFEPLTGKLLWQMDCGGPVPPNVGPKGFGKRNFFVATPAVHKNVIYVGLNQTWEQDPLTPRPLLAIELLTEGKTIRPKLRWAFDHKDFAGGTLGSAAIGDDGKVYVVSRSATLFALDAAAGKPLWKSKLGTADDAALFSSPYIHDGLLYVANCNEELFVFSLAGPPKHVGRYYFGGVASTQNTPIFVHGDRLYVAATGYLWALKKDHLNKK